MIVKATKYEVENCLTAEYKINLIIGSKIIETKTLPIFSKLPIIIKFVIELKNENLIN